MSTKRSRKHQWIVLRQKASRRKKRERGICHTEPLGLLQVKPASWQHSEKMLQTHNNRSQKTRHINIRRALAAESAYEWHKQYQYSEIAENLYKTGPVSIDFSLNPEFVQKLWEVLKDD